MHKCPCELDQGGAWARFHICCVFVCGCGCGCGWLCVACVMERIYTRVGGPGLGLGLEGGGGEVCRDLMHSETIHSKRTAQVTGEWCMYRTEIAAMFHWSPSTILICSRLLDFPRNCYLLSQVVSDHPGVGPAVSTACNRVPKAAMASCQYCHEQWHRSCSRRGRQIQPPPSASGTHTDTSGWTRCLSKHMVTCHLHACMRLRIQSTCNTRYLHRPHVPYCSAENGSCSVQRYLVVLAQSWGRGRFI